jgi:uncharacterized protein with GYD domain
LETGYTPEAWPALVQNPEDRREAIRSEVEGLRGTVYGAWHTFGEYDTVLILELPDNVAGAATSTAFTSGAP